MNLIWNEIIIHHSDTPDNGAANDWEAIRRFHKSWRLDGKIINQEDGERLMAEGKPVIRPWHDIGYHFGLESVKGKAVVQVGRPLNEVGAHCVGHNETGIGICCVGDFDKEHPSEAIYYDCALLCYKLIIQFPLITVDSIYPHSKFSPKTCPGTMFDIERLTRYVRVFLTERNLS